MWSRARGVWETTQTAICGHSEPYSQTWTPSGMTRNGSAFELPTWGPATDANAFSLPPTPRATRGGSASETLDLRTAVTLLPTPMTTDGKGIGPADLDRHSPQLRALPKLLPTPRASDGPHGGPNSHGSKGDLALPAAVHQFGGYGPAIDRHERVFARTAPSPTEPGRGGNPRLAARFAEWMMCLPDGWVTDPTIWEGMTDTAARNAQLHALGNGVVPPQAVAAVTHLIRVGLS